TAANIPVGAQARLTPADARDPARVDQFRFPFDVEGEGVEGGDGWWPKIFKKVAPETMPRIRPNSYWALLDSAPFVEEGLSGVQTRNGKTLVYGIQLNSDRPEAAMKNQQ